MVLAAVHCDGIDSAMEPDAVKQALMAAPSVMSIAKFASGRHPGPPDIRQLRQGVRGADQPSEARRLPGGGGVGGSSTRRDREHPDHQLQQLQGDPGRRNPAQSSKLRKRLRVGNAPADMAQGAAPACNLTFLIVRSLALTMLSHKTSSWVLNAIVEPCLSFPALVSVSCGQTRCTMCTSPRVNRPPAVDLAATAHCCPGRRCDSRSAPADCEGGGEFHSTPTTHTSPE